MIEQTLVLIKPDAMKLGHFDAILQRFESDGFRSLAIRCLKSKTETVEEHYREIFAKHPEYRVPVVEYITSGILAAIIFEREDAVQRARQLLGPLTNASAGTIRGDFRGDQSDPLHSVVHASDSSDAAIREIKIWFSDKEQYYGLASDFSASRRDFTASLLFGLFFAMIGGRLFARMSLMDNKEQRELLFAQAIASQKNSDTDKARRCAKQCLDLLQSVQSLEESATSKVSLEVDGQSVLLPGLLHTDTALLRFRSVGIQV